jgi:hypothetical protein
MTFNYSFLASDDLLATHTELAEFLRNFDVVSTEDWIASVKAATGEADGPSPALAARDYVACLVAGSEMHDVVSLKADGLGIPVYRIDSGSNSPHLIAELFCTLMRLVDASRRHAAQEMMSNGRLRREYEEPQRRFLRLEYFVYSLGGPQLSMLEQHHPSTETLRLTPDGGPSVTQPLSGTINGLIAIELHLSGSFSASPKGLLDLAVRDTLGQVHKAASLRISSLVNGWNRFVFSEAIDCTDRDGTLALKLNDADPGSFVDLGLGRPSALPEQCLISPEGITGDAPLAFRSWRGIAGSRLPETGQTRTGGKVQFSRPSTLPFPCALHCSDKKISLSPVQYWTKENAVLIHPPARGITIGAIENVTVADLRRIRAVIHNAHKEAPVIRFGLKALPTGSSLADRTDVHSCAATSFRWTTLPADCWGEISFDCADSMSGPIDLILAAMVADGTSNHMAWALFRGFELHLGGD